MSPRKIAVIGNACSGKTKLSRALAAMYNLPLVHVDSIQFLVDMKLRDPADTRKILELKSNDDAWVIDGFGPLKIIENRFQKADVVVFVRFSQWRNYWWCFKRQIKGLFARRSELPEGCFESTFSQTFNIDNLDSCKNFLCNKVWITRFSEEPALHILFPSELAKYEKPMMTHENEPIVAKIRFYKNQTFKINYKTF